MRFLLLFWLGIAFACGAIAFCFEICNDAYSFDWPKSTEFPFQVLLGCFVAQASDEKSLEGIASNVRILVRL